MLDIEAIKKWWNSMIEGGEMQTPRNRAMRRAWSSSKYQRRELHKENNATHERWLHPTKGWRVRRL